MKTKKIEESIKNKFSLLQNNLTQTNKKNDDLKINQINYEEIKLENGKYVGQIINGIREGKGIRYWDNGDRYEGYFRNGEQEGKGIKYWNNGDRYEGYWNNGKKDGKGIMYWSAGDKYEGDWKDDLMEGKGIYYFNV